MHITCSYKTNALTTTTQVRNGTASYPQKLLWIPTQPQASFLLLKVSSSSSIFYSLSLKCTSFKTIVQSCFLFLSLVFFSLKVLFSIFFPHFIIVDDPQSLTCRVSNSLGFADYSLMMQISMFSPSSVFPANQQSHIEA